MNAQTEIRPGMPVTSRDGQRLGIVSWVAEDEWVIAAGEVFWRDQSVAWEDVLEVRAGQVMLVHDLETLRAVNAQLAATLPHPRERTTAPARPVEETRSGAGMGAEPRDVATPTTREGLDLQPNDLQQVRMDEAEYQRFSEGVAPDAVERDPRYHGALHLTPHQLERARMESSKFLRLHRRESPLGSRDT